MWSCRRSKGAAALVTVALAATACGGADDGPSAASQAQPTATTAAARPEPYPVTVRNCGTDYTFTKAPERVVTPSVPGTELMLALGLERRLAGVVGAATVLAPEFQPKMAGVNVITERTFPPPSRESVLAVGPDLIVSGYSEDFAATALGDRGELKGLGVSSYLVQGKCGDSKATLDDTYADIENLGKVFNVPAEATAVVAKLKAEAAAARPAASRLKVLIYAAGREQPSTQGASTLVADLVARAGGENIFPEIASFGRFGWETVVERNPDVVLVVTTGSFPITTAEEFLYGYEPVAGVNAVRNRRVFSVGVNDVQPGPRNGQALVTIAKGLAGG